MERHLPHSDGRVRTSPRQPPLGDPEDAIDAARNSVHNRDFPRDFPDAPHVYVCIERPGSAVQRVRGPAECVDAGGVEGPAGGDHLALRHVVQYELAAGLIGGRDKCGRKGFINRLKRTARRPCVGVCVRRAACVGVEGRKEEEGGTYVARSELRAIRGEREGTHEATVGLQQASLLERLAIPVIEPNLLILYTRREQHIKKKKIDGDNDER